MRGSVATVSPGSPARAARPTVDSVTKAPDSISGRMRALNQPRGLGNSGRFLREVIRQQLHTSRRALAFGASAESARVEQKEAEDTRRRHDAALKVGLVVWPLFGLLDCFVARQDRSLLTWLLSIRAIGLALIVGELLLVMLRPRFSKLVAATINLKFVWPTTLIALMCVRFDGIESRYSAGVMLVLIIRAAFFAEPWRQGLLPFGLCWLMLPLTMLAAAPFDPLIAAQLRTSSSLTIFAMQNFFCLSAALAGLACSDGAWRLRRAAYENRSMGGYRLKQRIGRGGMGEVWLANHVRHERDVALKILTARGSREEEAVARFEREVRAIAKLTHPNTVRILDHGVTSEGIWFYTMELLEGADLAALLRREGPLPVRRALALMQQACAALSQAHDSGVVHRDLKPANLFVATVAGQSDVVKVLDFGLAKFTHETDSTQLTHDGLLLGTPRYMAPEVIQGSCVDARSDVYALGCVLYEMLAGRPPFEELTMAGLLHQQTFEPAPPPSTKLGAALPADVESIVMRCLEKSRDRRFADATQLGEALQLCGLPSQTA